MAKIRGWMVIHLCLCRIHCHIPGSYSQFYCYFGSVWRSWRYHGPASNRLVYEKCMGSSLYRSLCLSPTCEPRNFYRPPCGNFFYIWINVCMQKDFIMRTRIFSTFVEWQANFSPDKGKNIRKFELLQGWMTNLIRTLLHITVISIKLGSRVIRLSQSSQPSSCGTYISPYIFLNMYHFLRGCKLHQLLYT